MMLVFPADVVRSRRVDEHFAGEAEAARAAGWSVGLVDHDALAGLSAAAAVARLPAGETVAYRGWMLSPIAYEGFAAALEARGTRMVTGAGQYRRGHELPGWYGALSAFTPESVWTVGSGRDGFEAARAVLGSGAAVVRDYSKSMKHYWDSATYIPDLADADAAWKVASRMAELRGDEFAGGFVLRRFESFAGAEVRSWWVDGTCRLLTAHPDTPDRTPPPDVDVTAFAPAVAGLNLPFVTVDLVRRTDGVWRIVELGDAQVSDRPTSTPPEALITILPRT